MIVNSEGPADAKIFFVGEAPGKDEDIIGKPFVGTAGRTLNIMLSQAGINRPECMVGNVARERPPGNKISFYFEDKRCTIPKPKLALWVEQLKEEIIDSNANVIVALGATALWALTGEKKISNFRGYAIPCTLVPGKKVIPTYHPQAVNYEWKLHFPTILDLRKARFHSEFQGLSPDPTITVPSASKEMFIRYCQDILDDPDKWRITTDVETVQPGCHISMIGFAHSPHFAMSVKFLNGKVPCLPETDERELWYWIGRVLTEKKIIIQNVSYDKSVALMNHGILIREVWMDTLLAAHCCFPELPRDLGFLASILLDIAPWKHTAEDNKSLYNALDCCRTHGIALALDKEMNRQKVRHTFDFEMSELDPAIMMQLQGNHIDREVQKKLSLECDRIIEETDTKLAETLGKRINYNSPKQLQQLLYIDLGLPVQYKRRKSINEPRVITANKEALKKLAVLVPNNPIFNLVIENKKYLKYKSNFIDIDLSPNDTVHTSYNITGKKMTNKDTDDEGRKSFGRWSSSESIILPYGSGNLQNIPEFAREMYTAPEGYEYICADYVQAEAVVVAYIINDMKAKKLFSDRRLVPYEEKHNFDIHKLTASMMFGKPVEEIDTDTKEGKEMRRIGKTIRHAGNYDAGQGAISATLGCSIKEAKLLKDLYHRTTPQLRLWYQRIQQKLQQDRILVNLFGRIHRFLDRLGDDLYRSAYAYIPQATIGDLMNRSIVRLYNKYGHETWMVLQLHDGVYFVNPIGQRAQLVSRILECMTETLTVNNEEFIIEMDFKAGPNWKELEEFNHEELLR